eukprot:4154856-Pleurochrysis_carterae.AAC.1
MDSRLNALSSSSNSAACWLRSFAKLSFVGDVALELAGDPLPTARRAALFNMSECAFMRAKAAFQDFSAALALETSTEQHCNACCSSKGRMPASMRRRSWDADGG